jgi:CRP-like cAMP-binding protein
MDTELPVSNLLENLEPEARGRLAVHGEFRLLETGEPFITQGSAHGTLSFVVSGELEAQRLEGAEKIKLGTISAGEWVGEVAFIDGSPAVCDVAAAQPSQLWSIKRAALDDFLRNNPADGVLLMDSIARLLCSRIRDVTRKLAWRTVIS